MTVKIVMHDKEFLEKLNRDIYPKLHDIGQVVAASAREEVPVKTGALQRDIDYGVNEEEKQVIIGNTLFYAPFIELGTRKISPRRYLTRALRANIRKFLEILGR